jgi:hypothetical protein
VLRLAGATPRRNTYTPRVVDGGDLEVETSISPGCQGGCVGIHKLPFMRNSNRWFNYAGILARIHTIKRTAATVKVAGPDTSAASVTVLVGFAVLEPFPEVPQR